MVTITVGNKKGGVGKTTTAYHLAAQLHQLNKSRKVKYRVLVLDLDGQCNLSRTAGINDDGPTMHTVMMREVPLENAIMQTDWFDLVQGSPAMNTISKSLPEGIGRYMRVNEALKTVQNEYDFCILDTPPAIDVVTTNALIASDYIVIPAEANELSTDGIAAIYASIADTKQYYNPDIKIAGILLTRFKKQTTLARNYRGIFEKMAKAMKTKVFSTPIRENVNLSEVPSFHVPVFAFRPESSGAEDYAAFAKEILEDIRKDAQSVGSAKKKAADVNKKLYTGKAEVIVNGD